MRDPDSFDAFHAGCVRRVTSQLHAITGDLTEAEALSVIATIWRRRLRRFLRDQELSFCVGSLTTWDLVGNDHGGGG